MNLAVTNRLSRSCLTYAISSTCATYSTYAIYVFAICVIEHFALSAAPDKDKLALYYSRTCPYCALVTKAIDRLGLDIELREIFDEPRYRDELIAVRGRATVPVLRITSPGGEERWMPESHDIVRYLETID